MKIGIHSNNNILLTIFFNSFFLFIKSIFVSWSVPLLAGDLTVVDHAWTNRIDQASKQFGIRYTQKAPAKTLYFWTKMKGGSESLEWLLKHGKLPIKHEWTYSDYFIQDFDEIDPENEKKLLTAGDIKGARNIKGLIDKNGSFRWRTWSRKDSVRRGKWWVTIKYADDEIVKDENDNPCRWMIEVK
jgi:hypothetical protein